MFKLFIVAPWDYTAEGLLSRINRSELVATMDMLGDEYATNRKQHLHDILIMQNAAKQAQQELIKKRV